MRDIKTPETCLRLESKITTEYVLSVWVQDYDWYVMIVRMQKTNISVRPCANLSCKNAYAFLGILTFAEARNKRCFHISYKSGLLKFAHNSLNCGHIWSITLTKKITKCKLSNSQPVSSATLDFTRVAQIRFPWETAEVNNSRR